MSRTNNMLDIINAGLRAQTMRQGAISSNLANLETPGYRRLDVKFEELLSKAIGKNGQADISKAVPEMFNPENTAVQSNGNDVHLETEVGNMIEASLKHTTLIRVMQKKYRQMEMAINTR